MRIASEDRAEALGKQLTAGGERDKDFTVFWYEHRPSRLTFFGVEIKANGNRVVFAS